MCRPFCFYMVYLFCLLVIIYGSLMLYWCFCWIRKPQFVGRNSVSNSTSIGVVVALCNEAEVAPQIISSLKMQIPVPIVLVNDHSIDDTFRILTELTSDCANISVANNVGKKGKKNALKLGVTLLDGCEMIVCTDADCILHPNWINTFVDFIEIEKPQIVIAPVVMRGNGTFFTHLFELDFLALQVCTAGSALAKMPFMCNGANIAFRPNNDYSQKLKPQYISGDDMFMLSAVKAEGGKIAFLKNSDALVATDCPTTMHAFVRQRTRWLRKASGFTDWQMICFPILIFCANMVWPISIVLSAVGVFDWQISAVISVAKLIVDYIVLLCGRKFWKVNVDFFSTFTLFVLYPFYILWIAIASVFRSKTEW